MEYLLTKLHEYDKTKSSNYNFWKLFQDDFKDFIITTFNQVYTYPELKYLRAYLYCGDVYVEQSYKRLSII